jgi:membrane protein required for colicin V production
VTSCQFTLLDGLLIFVMLISAVLAMIRGLTREVFSVGSWIAAAAAAYFLWERVLPYTEKYVDDRNLALGVTIAGIFFITLLVVSLITMRISDFVLDSRAGPLDRTLGFIFGAARGLILVIIAVLFVNFFIAPERQPGWIAMAKSKPWLDSLGSDLMARLPEDPEAEILQRLRGESVPATQSGTAAPSDTGTPPASASSEPGIAPDDQNELERQIETPPPDQ